MSLVDEVARVLREHPELIASALESRPEVVYAVLAKLTPWDKLATKEDLKTLVDLIDRRFQDVNRRFEDINHRFQDVNKRFEDINHRFEDVNKRFEDVNHRFEDINRRFEDINKRFEEVNRRFEDLRYYVDKRVGFLEKLIIGLNIPILATVITTLIKLLL